MVLFLLFQEAEAEVKKCKKALADSKKAWSEKEAEEASLKLELEELDKAIKEAQTQIANCDEAINGSDLTCDNI